MPLHLPEGHPVRVRGWVGKDVTDEIGEWLLDAEVLGAEGLVPVARFAEKCFGVPFVLLYIDLDADDQAPMVQVNIDSDELRVASRRAAQRLLGEMGFKLHAADVAKLSGV